MAGKKRDGGSVKVKITDDGSLKNLGKNAKKAGKTLVQSQRMYKKAIED